MQTQNPAAVVTYRVQIVYNEAGAVWRSKCLPNQFIIKRYNNRSMRAILSVNRRFFCDLNRRNRQLLRKANNYERDLHIHQKASKIDEKVISDFVMNTPKEKIANEMAKRSDYDKQLKDFIDKFNVQHKNKVTLLDFTNYVTDFGDLRDTPLRKDDIELIKQFQKRTIDQKVVEMRKRIAEKQRLNETAQLEQGSPESYISGLGQQNEAYAKQLKQSRINYKKENIQVFRQRTYKNGQAYRQGPFMIQDDFMILLLNVKVNTKVTTLNRIMSIKTLLFMGNGNGLISYAKGSGRNSAASLENALQTLKKNIIALPRDSRCTLPLPIHKKFQDFELYLRPTPAFNAHGHPTMAFLLTMAGIEHAGFYVVHTEKNVYDVLKVFYKSIVTNTTPQELAEREGFKVYRHQFIRPLTYVRTNGLVCNKQAKARKWKRLPKKRANLFDFKM